jgi:hypothetical protein
VSNVHALNLMNRWFDSMFEEDLQRKTPQTKNKTVNISSDSSSYGRLMSKSPKVVPSSRNEIPSPKVASRKTIENQRRYADTHLIIRVEDLSCISKVYHHIRKNTGMYLNFAISRATHLMIIHHAYRLHDCVDNGGTNKIHSTTFEVFADCV